MRRAVDAVTHIDPSHQPGHCDPWMLWLIGDAPLPDAVSGHLPTARLSIPYVNGEPPLDFDRTSVTGRRRQNVEFGLADTSPNR
jgi:hypothetical protein